MVEQVDILREREKQMVLVDDDAKRKEILCVCITMIKLLHWHNVLY